MLPLTRGALPVLSRRANLLLCGAAAAALAVPTVYLARAPRAVADETPTPGGVTVPATPTVAETPPASAPQTAKQPQPTITPTAVQPVLNATFERTVNPAIEFLPQLTAHEKEIVAALEKPATFETLDTPLQDFLDVVRSEFEIEIQLDPRGLADAGVEPSTPINRHVKNVSLRSALRLVLDEIELCFVVQDDVLLITSREKADSMLTTRTYPIKDLLATNPVTPPNMVPPPADDGRKLIDAISNTVAADSWEDNGGNGSLQFVPASQSLVVSQTYDKHEQVLAFLRAQRAVRALNGQ